MWPTVVIRGHPVLYVSIQADTSAGSRRPKSARGRGPGAPARRGGAPAWRGTRSAAVPPPGNRSGPRGRRDRARQLRLPRGHGGGKFSFRGSAAPIITSLYNTVPCHGTIGCSFDAAYRRLRTVSRIVKGVIPVAYASPGNHHAGSRRPGPAAAIPAGRKSNRTTGA